MTPSSPDPEEALVRLPDGTVRQVSPLTGTVVWTVPGRANRPFASPIPQPWPLGTGQPDAWCAFCPNRYLETPPERARLVLRAATIDPGGAPGSLGARAPRAGSGPASVAGAGAAAGAPAPWAILRHLRVDQLHDTVAEFRRIPNLFPILSNEYWRANHGYQVPREVAARARAYVAMPEGRAHVLGVARARLRAAGATADEAATEPEERLLERAADLFVGWHDLVVARRHFVDGATVDDELASSGDLTPREHHAYLALTVDALRDLTGSNPFVRYVAVFQNWLRPAGASFDHLHRQLVAIDEHGPQLTRELELLRAAPDLFNTAIADPAARARLVVAENAHAIAMAGVGHRYPTIEVYSTGPVNLPWEHQAAALRGVSDVLHACHAATGRLVPTNEEWHYRPSGAQVGMPWRMNLKWRVSTLAGFEGGTKINVNTIDPFTLHERVVVALHALRDAGRIGPMAIGDECSHRLGVLRYSRA